MAASKACGVAWEGSSAIYMARIINDDGEILTQSDVSSINYYLYDLDGATPSTPTQSGTLSAASTVFDTLQTDSRWTKDSTGYNFRHTLTAAWLADGDHTYRMEYVIVTTGSATITAVAEITTKNVRSS